MSTIRAQKSYTVRFPKIEASTRKNRADFFEELFARDLKACETTAGSATLGGAIIDK